MTSYESYLLSLAVEHAPYNRVIVWRDDDGWWRAECAIDAPTSGGTYLASALTVLLRDVLKVEVPERPSAESIAATADNLKGLHPKDVRWLAHSHRIGLLVPALALLEGGEA